MVENRGIRDGWTDHAGYTRRYQSEEQIREVLGLLELADARGFVDIGCGNGASAVPVAVRHPECDVWALDPLETAVAECERRAAEAGVANLHAEVASANAIPLPDATVDRALMRNVLHHVADADAAYAEIARILRPSCLLLLEAPCNPGDDGLGALISDIHMLMDDSHRRTYHRPEAISAGLARHGIATEGVKQWPYWPGMSERQVELIRNSRAEEALHLSRDSDGRWTIELSLVRIVVRKAGC